MKTQISDDQSPGTCTKMESQIHTSVSLINQFKLIAKALQKTENVLVPVLHRPNRMQTNKSIVTYFNLSIGITYTKLALQMFIFLSIVAALHCRTLKFAVIIKFVYSKMNVTLFMILLILLSCINLKRLIEIKFNITYQCITNL